MFYFLDAQGCAHFSNLPFELPDYPDTASKWQELRPGCTLRLKPSSKKASKVEIVRHSPMVALPATLSPPQADMSPGVTAWRGVDEANARRDSISDEDEGGEEGTLFRLE